MKKKIIIVISIIVVGIIGVGVYFGQKEYYRKQAIENTKFIKAVADTKSPDFNYYTFRQIFGEMLDHPVWTQSKVKDNKYVVACSGNFGNSRHVVIEFYMKEQNEKVFSYKEENMRAIINGKSANAYFAAGLLYMFFQEKHNLKMDPETENMMNTLNILIKNKQINYDKYNLDYDIFEKAAKKYDDIQVSLQKQEEQRQEMIQLEQQQKEEREQQQQELDEQVDQQQQEEEIQKYQQTGGLSPED